MTQVTLQLPDELARKVQSFDRWMPSILELSLLGLRTEAAATAAELIDFLSDNPSPEQVIDYHVSQERQTNLERLLALNETGLLTAKERQELEELEEIEHLVIMLKAEIATGLSAREE